MRSPWKPIVEGLMRRSLRASFRRVCWVGPPPALRPDVPVIAYANHHYFHDGYLMWLLLERLLGRPGLTWMADWDRFPFFAAAGARPFPPDDARRRARTLRGTLRDLRARPAHVLVLFPEGRLHPPEGGVLPFDATALARLDALLPEKQWWPVALHVTWWGEAQPTALLAGGTPRARICGDEPQQLDALLRSLHRADPGPLRVLLEGRHSPQERWHFAFLSRLFARYQ